ncbi:gastrin/cholecystokinin type B receptor-like [Lytechinus pictus]|uniref:gastrin/cholecystokinin type B receptor-like n=1 Tax=Lytechinus pictus TaxID=7653 RepID=UPI0030BA2100
MEVMLAIYVSYMTVSSFVGIFGNGIITRVFQKRKQKTSTDTLIIALAVVDLISSALLIVAIIWAVTLDFRTRFNCVFFWFFRRLFACESALLASIIAVDRYIMVCSPFKLRTSRKKAVYWVAASNIMCTVICLPFIPYGNAVGAVCIYKGPIGYHYAFLTVMNLIYLSACISCPVCYSRIYRKIKRHHQDTAYMHVGITSTAVSSTKDSGISESPKKELQGSNEVNQGHDSGDHVHVNNGEHSPQRCVPEPNDSQGDTTRSRISLGNDHAPIPAISGSVGFTKSSSPTGHCGAKNRVSPADVPGPASVPAPAPIAKPRIQKDRMTKMMFIVTVIYVISCMPVVILENLGQKYIALMQQSAAGEATVNFLYQIRLINHIVNIFVYYSVNEKFRRETHDLFSYKRK